MKLVELSMAGRKRGIFAANGHDDALKAPFGGFLGGLSSVFAHHFRCEAIYPDAVRPFCVLRTHTSA